MKDISKILEKAISMSSGYNAELVSTQIEEIPNMWCRLEDDSNLKWYLISKSNGKSVIKCYGYLSVQFPVAILKRNCPKKIYNLLLEKKIVLEEYCEKYSCEKNILRNLLKKSNFIDDRFLYDENFPFDEEAFLKIDEGIKYINPYNFTFNDLKLYE